LERIGLIFSGQDKGGPAKDQATYQVYSLIAAFSMACIVAVFSLPVSYKKHTIIQPFIERDGTRRIYQSFIEGSNYEK
jgi:hypothetical protein